ncbi:GNAT family N-acetyltransferase [Pseudoalteromonas haloplanktis]|uniref:GNAT family N-acetyltransferase n=1 Tax=Pseudoalteromonas haloplanktis TaxID=228 RepID=A0ABU1BCH8_PSEHA|nr:GNAT family N-acetyltransferase [Pseudoalteromonas haloplanktis]MDQ9091471.1 GNAT family N-acetyltransferase [Pseudoalteromonas haloplanktis]
MEVMLGNSPELIAQAHAIRHQVFVVEQNIPQQLDLDGLDTEAVHVVVTDAGSLVATARLLQRDKSCAVMARIAVLKQYRGAGVAKRVINALLSHATKIGLTVIEIHAHAYLRDYYQHFGFHYVKDVEVVGEHQLIEMHYCLNH